MKYNTLLNFIFRLILTKKTTLYRSTYSNNLLNIPLFLSAFFWIWLSCDALFGDFVSEERGMRVASYSMTFTWISHCVSILFSFCRIFLMGVVISCFFIHFYHLVSLVNLCHHLTPSIMRSFSELLTHLVLHTRWLLFEGWMFYASVKMKMCAQIR